MKLQNKLNKFCKNCQTHQLFLISKQKKNKVSPFAWIERQRARYGKRGNLGKFSKAVAKRYKNAKKPFIRLECTICKKIRHMSLKRTNKFELIKK